MAQLENIDKREPDSTIKFGTSFPKQVVVEVEAARGDTPRGLWLRRLAIKELERQKPKEKGEEKGKDE
jgi:hypothetical protein